MVNRYLGRPNMPRTCNHRTRTTRRNLTAYRSRNNRLDSGYGDPQGPALLARTGEI
nr:unnamed protein product [Callosobruchus chinensis]